jgi:hypothetical protein
MVLKRIKIRIHHNDTDPGSLKGGDPKVSIIETLQFTIKNARESSASLLQNITA